MGNLKEIEGSYFKECRVIMLPTKDKSILYKHISNNLHIGNYDICHPNDTERINQHLYITSNDEIKEGDWFMLGSIPRICTSCTKITVSTDNVWSNRKLVKKIIATTDKSLRTSNSIPYSNDRGGLTGRRHIIPYLPEPPHKFIKKYCELGGVDKVLVEYEESKSKEGTYDYSSKTGLPLNPIIKVDYKNFITIKSLKEKVYSRAEHNEIARNAFRAGMAYESLSKRGFKSEAISEDDWIKQNL